MKFDIVMPLSSADGYGYSGECLVLAAKKQGADIGVYPHDWKEEMYTAEELLDMRVSTWDQSGVLVVYFIPYAFHHFRAKTQIGMTMFETTEIPDVWARFCAIPKAVIVPSEFCKETFDKKLLRPTHVVPLGVDTEVYSYREREDASEFTFLMAGLLHYRKGAEFAVKAFKEEFSEKEPVRLILKTRKNFFDIGSETLRKDIEVINWNYSRDQMLDLYEAADCFLAPSRGEASGLTPREASSTGLVSIVTNWGGLTEIANPRYTYPLDIEGLEPAPAICSSYSEGITQGESIGDFCVPSVEHLREQMRYVYEHPDEARAKGRLASEWIQERWNYDRCAAIWLDTIRKIINEV